MIGADHGPVRDAATDLSAPDMQPPDAPGPPADDVADARWHKLDPRVVDVERIGHWIFSAVVTGGLLLQIVVTLAASPARLGVSIGLAVAALPLLAWWSHRWPALAYEYASYRVDDIGIEIRRGVIFRRAVVVPRSRVQHTDVSQGPIQRAFELGTLVVYTAGADHARVELPGLAHARALRIRDHLLPTGGDDAV